MVVLNYTTTTNDLKQFMFQTNNNNNNRKYCLFSIANSCEFIVKIHVEFLINFKFISGNHYHRLTGALAYISYIGSAI